MSRVCLRGGPVGLLPRVPMYKGFFGVETFVPSHILRFPGIKWLSCLTKFNRNVEDSYLPGMECCANWQIAES